MREIPPYPTTHMHGALVNQRRHVGEIEVPCALSVMYLTTAKRLHRTSKTLALPRLEARRSKGGLSLQLKASNVLMVRRSFRKIAHGDLHLMRHSDVSTGTLSAAVVLGSLSEIRCRDLALARARRFS